MMREDGRRLQGGPLLGLIVFGLSMAILVLVAPLLVGALGGMWGSATSELLLGLMPVVLALALRLDLKAVFPFRRVSGRQVGGTVVLWLGFFGLAIMFMTLALWFLPQQASRMLQSAPGSQYGQLPFIPLLLLLALQPAVCEEILARGLMQYSFRGWNKWVCILVTGILFGAMHMDLMRMVSLSALGIGLSYLRYKTGNLWMPMLFHFINNGLAALFLWIAANSVGVALPGQGLSQLQVEAMGVLLPVSGLLWGMGAPLLIFGASILLEPPRPLGRYKYRDKRTQFIVTLVCTLLIAAAFGLALSKLAGSLDADFLDTLITQSIYMIR